MAIYSISLVIMPARAYSSCVTRFPGLRAQRPDVGSGRIAAPTAVRRCFNPSSSGRRLRPRIFLDIAARENPFVAQRRQPLRDVNRCGIIRVGTGGVVEPNRRFAARERHFAERHAVHMDFARARAAPAGDLIVRRRCDCGSACSSRPFLRIVFGGRRRETLRRPSLRRCQPDQVQRDTERAVATPISVLIVKDAPGTSRCCGKPARNARPQTKCGTSAMFPLQSWRKNAQHFAVWVYRLSNRYLRKSRCPKRSFRYPKNGKGALISMRRNMKILYRRSIDDPNGFWGEQGRSTGLDQAIHPGEGHILRSAQFPHPLVCGRNPECGGELHRPPSENARANRSRSSGRATIRRNRATSPMPNCIARSAASPMC